MMLLIVGRNRVLSLVVWFSEMYFWHLWCCLCSCDVAFSMFFPVMVRWIDVLPSCYSCSSSVHSLTHVDPGLLDVEVLCLISHFESLGVFLCFYGRHFGSIVRHKNVSHAHTNYVVRYYKVLHAFLRSFVRHWKSVARLLEKCRTTLEECHTPSWEISYDTFPVSYALWGSVTLP